LRATSRRETYLGIRLVPLSRKEALCFVSTLDKPFLLSKVAGTLTIHDCHILEADIHDREGIVNDLFRIRIPQKYDPRNLENMIFETLQKVLRGDTNIENEIFLWEKRHEVIQDKIVPRFKSVKDYQGVLTIQTSNKRGLLHKISWALALAGMNIDNAIIAATEDMRAEDVFWIRQRHGEKMTRRYQKKVLDLLNVIVNEGQDPVDQVFKKEIYMIYRQQLRRQGSGFRTAQLYADVHLRLIRNLFDRIRLELEIENEPILIGVYGGIGSGAIGFTSDIDCIFLYDGERKEEYDKLKRALKNEFKRISDLDVDESFLPYHVNFFYLGRYDGESVVSFDDFFDYVNYIDEVRNQSENRFFEPQFFHYPWAFSIRFVGNKDTLDRFTHRMQEKLPRKRRKRYWGLKAYVVGEKGKDIKADYVAYLKGKYFPNELAFCNTKRLEQLYRNKNYERFIESILPYDAIKYIFRRGIFPLLHILRESEKRTDLGLLRNEHRHIRPAVDFMLKAFNVRKTLFIMGKWDLSYFLYIMNAPNARSFCRTYLDYARKIVRFVKSVAE
jgi:acetolactate synthase small subunit